MKVGEKTRQCFFADFFFVCRAYSGPVLKTYHTIDISVRNFYGEGTVMEDWCLFL